MTELELQTPGRKGQFWPAAVITLGIVLTVGWVILLGFGLVKLIELAL
jgi:hypothetical protein